MKRFTSVLALVTGIAAAFILFYATTGGNASPPVPVVAAPDTPAGPQDLTLEITYVANEGVLVASGDKQVLIDGLHREYQPGYAFLPEEDQERIEHAEAPFDGIDLVLVTHRHLDHFHPVSVGLHLRHNAGARLVASHQVIEEIEKHFDDEPTIQARATAATPPVGEKIAMQVAGIDLEILGLRHVGRRHRSIQNLGYLIRLGDKTILHVGDAEATVENFAPFDLGGEGIDVAFLPVWFLLDEDRQAVVRETIAPGHVIAVHVSPDGAENTVERIRRVYPDADAFTTLLETRRY